MSIEAFRSALGDESQPTPALDELFTASRSARDGGSEGDMPDPAEFLRERGIDVPAAGTLSVVFTERDLDQRPLRPEPGCPGGWCVPERCPDGVRQCGWICYCP